MLPSLHCLVVLSLEHLTPNQIGIYRGRFSAAHLSPHLGFGTWALRDGADLPKCTFAAELDKGRGACRALSYEGELINSFERNEVLAKARVAGRQAIPLLPGKIDSRADEELITRNTGWWQQKRRLSFERICSGTGKASRWLGTKFLRTLSGAWRTCRHVQWPWICSR